MANELAIIETGALVPTQVFAPGGIDAILAEIEAKVRAENVDISTKKGREACASLAYKVARSKTALDDMGKDLVSGIKEQAAKIDADRRKARERLDALRDDVRKPLDDYEAAEAARIAAHETALAEISEPQGYGFSETAAELANRLACLEAYPSRDWQEFKVRADKAIAAEIERTKGLLAAAQKREAEAAELDRLRREEEARRAKEEAERIERERQEREARIAEEARQEAARAAQVEAERIAKETAEREARIERERAQAVADAKAAEEARIAAEKKAEADKIAAAEEAARREAAAAQRERDRIAAEKAAEDEAARQREADKAHRAEINNAIVAALIEAGISDDDAKVVVIAIARGRVPHVRIQY